MYCHLCFTEFHVDETDVGKTIVCPNCQVPVLVENKILIFNCPECGKPLSVESWMIGEEAICPECGKEIVLHFPKSDVEETPEQEDKFLEAETFLPGETVGDYLVVRCLGIGGMGEVYLVRHKEMGNTCALKLLKPEISAKNPIFSERLIREAKIAAKLQHPNLISVMDAHRDLKNGISYIVMEYVDGKSVGDLIKEKGPLPEAMVLTIAKSVTSVLITAEKNGIVHRDIKPSNIMLTKDGQVKLADLGIAKVSNDDIGNTLTQDNAVLGTPNYASPEQLRNSHAADIRSDIYSLGATMFHMLTGEMPFAGETVFGIISNVLEKDLPSLLEINPKISPSTALLVDRMLFKKPEERPASAQELMHLLEEIDTTKIASEGQIRKLVQKKKKARAGTVAGEQPTVSRWKKIVRFVVVLFLLVFIAVFGVKTYDALDSIVSHGIRLSDSEVSKLVKEPSVSRIWKAVNAENGSSNEQALILKAARTGNVGFLEQMDQENCFPALESRKYLDAEAMMAALSSKNENVVRWFLKKNPANRFSLEAGKTEMNLGNMRLFIQCGGSLDKWYRLFYNICSQDPSPELLGFCIKHGMRIEADDFFFPSPKSDTLMKWLFRSGLLPREALNASLVSRMNYPYYVKKIMDFGLDPLLPSAEGDSFLSLAIRKGMNAQCVQMLINSCKTIPPGGGKDSPLYSAVCRGDGMIVQALLAKGARPDEEIFNAASPKIRQLLKTAGSREKLSSFPAERPKEKTDVAGKVSAPEIISVPAERPEEKTDVAGKVSAPEIISVPAERPEEKTDVAGKVSAPEVISAESERNGASVEQKDLRTLEQRLAAAEQRYNLLNRRVRTDFDRQKLNVAAAQISLLRRQKKMKDELLSGRTREYDAAMTRDFQNKIREYTRKYHPQRDKALFADTLVRMLESGKVDPDAPLVNERLARFLGKDCTLDMILTSSQFVNLGRILAAWLKVGPKAMLKMKPFGRTYLLSHSDYATLALLKLQYPIDDPGAYSWRNSPQERTLVQKYILIGADLNTLGAGGRTILMDAVMRGKAAIVQDLLCGGADPNAPDRYGYTALHYALIFDHLEIANTLLYAGGSWDRANHAGKKPQECKSQNIFNQALLKGDVSAMRRAVFEGAVPDFPLSSGEKPLLYAARTYKYDVLNCLLDDRIEAKNLNQDSNIHRITMSYLQNTLSSDNSWELWSAVDTLVRKGAQIPERYLETYERFKSAKNSPPVEKIMISGIFDGEGLFRISGNMVTYHHIARKRPRRVNIDGREWNNLDKPFYLSGWVRKHKAYVRKISGRDTARLLQQSRSNNFEIFIKDGPDGVDKYKVSIQFH